MQGVGQTGIGAMTGLDRQSGFSLNKTKSLISRDTTSLSRKLVLIIIVKLMLASVVSNEI